MIRPDPLAAAVTRKAEINALLHRLQSLSDDHFGLEPDAVNWADVTPLTDAARLLHETLAVLEPPVEDFPPS